MTKSSRYSILILTALALFGRPGHAADPIDGYARWVRQAFGIEGTAAINQAFGTVGPSADPDQDGLSNLAEYAFGTDPKGPSTFPIADMVTVPALGDRPLLVLTATVRTDDAALVFVPQVSEDGANWYPFVQTGLTEAVGDNYYTAPVGAGPIVGGMRSVSYAALPNETLPNVQFIRLAIVRHAATASALGVNSTPVQPGPSAGHASVSALLAPSVQTVTPTLPGLNFTSQLAASMGNALTSNTIVMRGFSGRLLVTPPPGVVLVINGKEVVGKAYVKPGDTLSLKATSPAVADTTQDFKVDFSKGITATWSLGSKKAAALFDPFTDPNTIISGYTPVSASVGSSGDANVSLPITVSPGIGGMEPKLSIGYSSQGGNGLLGAGFNLGGLSAISRVGATIAQDGFRGSVKLTADDRYALDGARLISVP
ncbi:MAG TPA: SpvB/TcaC N-terminal domain-containing protein, partial [Chthoniobacteraceae bacterium]|nr:SpvB/TcaC N-terminal domain-containing protein [Chthoniobacteraceae bacterium]